MTQGFESHVYLSILKKDLKHTHLGKGLMRIISGDYNSDEGF